MQAVGPAVRRTLDRLYFGSGVIAALFLIAILSLVVLQMLARWTGNVFPGAADYAGYCMASASFFAFAHALNRGAHIRVSLLLQFVGHYRRWVEVWCFGIGSALGWYLAYYAGKGAYWSWKLHDISQGQDATPIWIPQIAMVLGSIFFAIALTDHLVNLIFFGDHRIEADLVDDHE